MKRIAVSMMMMGTMLFNVSSLPAQTNTVNQRERNQQQRIGDGVEHGTITSGEAARLEKQEAGIHKEVRQDRQANGGSLTAQERRRVNRQQNRESARIYKAKHNDRGK